MADKEVHVTSSGGGGGVGVIAGVLAVILIALGLIFFFGVSDTGNKGVDVNVEAPKVDMPKVDTPKVDVPGAGEGN
jgi:hypothetical protein